MSFEVWFDAIEKSGNRKSQRFYDILERLPDSPQYTEEVVNWLSAAYKQGQQDAAEKCANLCKEQANFLLRFSQFGSNAAKDCEARIIDTFLDKSV